MTIGFRNLTIFVIVFSLVTFTFFGAVAEISQNYSIDEGEEFKATFNQIDESYSSAEKLRNILINQTSGEADVDLGTIGNIIEAAKSLIRLPKSLFDLTFTLMKETSDFLEKRFSINPIYFQAATVILIMFTVIFIIQLLTGLSVLLKR